MENNFNKPNDRKDCPNKGKEISKQHSRRGELGFFDPFFDGFFRFPNFRDEFKEMEKVMKTDVSENENEYHLEVELPGYDKGDINLEINNGYLTIEAKHNNCCDEKDNKGNCIRRERYYGSCARSFYVGDIDEDSISASLDRGILHVTVPKEKVKDTKKRIEIK